MQKNISRRNAPKMHIREERPSRRAERRSLFKLCITFILCGMSISGCAPAASPPPGPGFVLVTLNPNSTITPTPFQPAPATHTAIPSATENATPTNIPTDTPLPTATDTFTPIAPTHTAVPATTIPQVTPAPPASTRTLYTFYLSINYAGKAAAVNETIRYANTTGQSSLERGYWPSNRICGRIVFRSVRLTRMEQRLRTTP